MANWIETETGELVNLDRMSRIFVREDAVRTYLDGSAKSGWGVMCSDGEGSYLIALYDNCEEAQAEVLNILLTMEKRNGNT